MKSIRPVVGKWYQELDDSSIFEVVAVDERNQTIETQYIDGEINEYDVENWYELALTEIEAPEDWRNAYELSSEDSLDPDDTIHPQDWSDPTRMIETDIVNGIIEDI